MGRKIRDEETKKQELMAIKALRTPESLKTDLVGMSKEFAMAQIFQSGCRKWGKNHWAIFALMLGKIDWREKGNINVIELDHKEIAKYLGWSQNLSQKDLKKKVKDCLIYMTENCTLKVQNPKTGNILAANFISSVLIKAWHSEIRLHPDFMPHFENLYMESKYTKKPFITMDKTDVCSFKNKYSPRLYQWLVSQPRNPNVEVQKKFATTKELKRVFGLDLCDYVSPKLTDEEMARMTEEEFEKYVAINFERSGFENRVLKPALEEIKNSEMINIFSTESSSDDLYDKQTRGGRYIKGYLILYSINSADDINVA